METPTPTTARLNLLGPLTTVFEPLPHCSRLHIICPTCATSGYRAQKCKQPGPGEEDDLACWPGPAKYPTPLWPFKGLGFYSPGLLCPKGYTSACSAASTEQGKGTVGSIATPASFPLGQFQFPLIAGEMAIGCCPTGFTCSFRNEYQTCHQAVSSTTISIVTCDTTKTVFLNNFQVPFTVDDQLVTTLHMKAPMVQINWQLSDKNPALKSSIDAARSSSLDSVREASQFSSTFSSVTGQARATIATITTPISSISLNTNTNFNDTVNAPPKDPPKTSQLPPRAVAGISIGSVLVLVSLLSLLLLYLYLRKRYLLARIPLKKEDTTRSSATSMCTDAYSSPPLELPSYIQELGQSLGLYYEIGNHRGPVFEIGGAYENGDGDIGIGRRDDQRLACENQAS
ncbi:hypothetical protein P154DRAFT_571193 [Amniculicola lignicola CBS 123094]|uniref:Uncharacterized protein n=1 Tax=Amniculicola lignicola CBS 123094 TaxID=1392246 RepID=A0A6A5X2H2_9PLEO|nr:hypothetical protein P154DRAFT_571193 [Amniculicola lignicola CBS 123094]